MCFALIKSIHIRFLYLIIHCSTPLKREISNLTMPLLPSGEWTKGRGTIWLQNRSSTLSQATSSLGCRRNSSSGSVLIKQLAEAQLLTSSETADPGVYSIDWTGHHLSQLLLDTGLRWHPVQRTEKHMSQLHLNTRAFPDFNQPTQLNIDRKVTEMMIYSGGSYFFWKCTLDNKRPRSALGGKFIQGQIQSLSI